MVNMPIMFMLIYKAINITYRLFIITFVSIVNIL